MSDDSEHGSRTKFEERLRRSLRIDPRYSVLDFRFANGYLYILTDSLSNAIHVSQVYQRESHDFRIKVILLPDASVGDSLKGICHVGVAPVRKSDNSTAEQVTQVLYGETFDALEVKSGWVRIKLHADGYIGWASSDQVTLFDVDKFYDFQMLPKLHTAMRVAEILEKPARTAPVIREVVYGTMLSTTGRSGNFFEIRLPDGISGWIDSSFVRESLRPKEYSAERILDTAKSFRGISYVWGGRSAKGFDCSGFVQTVFGLNGVEIPRDADMQFSTGTRVGKKLNGLRKGDLLFFSYNGDKINHVAIYTAKNKEFIHSSGFVRINSFDPKRKNFSSKLLSAFVGACRVV